MSEVVVSTLAECEAIIERGLTTFVEVGSALARIRDERLYLDSHKSFEDYCRERWDFNDRRASQMIQAAEVSTIVETRSLPTPRNEAVARELAPLRSEPAQLREVWTQAVEQHGPAPTAKQVHEVVAALRHETPTEKPEPTFCPTCGARIAAHRVNPARRP